MNTTHPAVAEYVARTQAELADLPQTEVEEIIEDIRQHVSEVATESGAEVSAEALPPGSARPSSTRASCERRPVTRRPRGSTTGWSPGSPWSLMVGTVLAFLTGLASIPREHGSPAGLIVIFGPFLALALILIFAGATTVEAVAGLPEPRVPTWTGRLASLRPGWWALRVVLLWFGRRARTDPRWGWIVANAYTIGLGIALLGWLLTAPPH